MPQPVRSGGPPTAWTHRKLYEGVTDALHALPSRFRTQLKIAGIAATDLFTLNTPLGAAIEQSVVDSLNDLREIWDPDAEYQRYAFVRQAQVFPDVRLQTSAPNVSDEQKILLGIELKGWFILSKEGEPSFRYCVTPNACAPQDLLVVFPWTLDEVVSGSPKLMRPFVEEARFAAEHRNYYWEELRGVTGPNSLVQLAPHQTPYPNKVDRFNDTAVSDAGGNFGRVARGGLMADYIPELLQTSLSGIPARYWQKFIKTFAAEVTPADIERGLANIRREADRAGIVGPGRELLDRLEAALRVSIEP